MDNQGIIPRVTQLAAPLAASLGYEIVEITYRREPVGWVLRFLLDRPGGITLADCERFSRAISPRLDREDPIPYSYTLEVSSAGVERPLHTESDFTRFAGQLAEIRLFAPINGRRRWQGVLAGVSPDHQVKLKVGETEETVSFPMESISRAHLLDPTLSSSAGQGRGATGSSRRKDAKS